MIASLKKRYTVRPMRHEDISQVAEIDREAFPTQWPPPNFSSELRNRLAHYMVVCEEDADKKMETAPEPLSEPPARAGGLLSGLKRLFGRDHEQQQRIASNPPAVIVGMVGFWLMFDESHIITIAVRQSHRGRGIGEKLLIAAIEKSMQLKAQVVTLEVRLTNTSAQALYEKYSFKKVGIRPRYYSDNKEDAIIMTTDPLPAPSYQELFQRLTAEHDKRWEEACPRPK